MDRRWLVDVKTTSTTRWLVPADDEDMAQARAEAEAEEDANWQAVLMIDSEARECRECPNDWRPQLRPRPRTPRPSAELTFGELEAEGSDE